MIATTRAACALDNITRITAGRRARGLWRAAFGSAGKQGAIASRRRASASDARHAPRCSPETQNGIPAVLIGGEGVLINIAWMLRRLPVFAVGSA